MRRRQLSFGDGLIAEEGQRSSRNWMKHADEVLVMRRLSRSCTRRWRNAIPTAVRAAAAAHRAEVVLRLLTHQAHPQLEL